MKNRQAIPALLLCLLLLSACSGPGPAQAEGEARLTVVATTYPVYLFTCAVADGVEGVEVLQLVNQPTSCLHDYTLTVGDMKTLERADVLVMNGAGLEDFLSAALETSDAAVIDCSAGVDLLEEAGHEGHDHDTEYDPHIWMDPARAAQMVENIGAGLAALDEDSAAAYGANSAAAQDLLEAWDAELRQLLCDGPDAPAVRELITFHEGFRYFADAYDFHILRAIEEEEGSEASAHEILAVVELIEEYRLPVIFTEANGSDATARAIQRETGVEVEELTMIMSGEESALSAYYEAQQRNAEAILRGFAGEGEEA